MMLDNRDYAEFFCYMILGVVVLYTVANIFRTVTCWSRYNISHRVLTNRRLRNASEGVKNPTRPSLLGLYPTIAFLTATLREMSYPQYLLFKRYRFLNPPPLGNIY